MTPLRAYPVSACLGLVAALCAAEPAGATPVYLDPAQPVEARINDLVGRLSLDEKAALLRNGTPGVPRLGLPKYDWWNEALHGVARAGEATVFPQAIGLAAMWDEPLQREIARTIGIEARAKYNAARGTPQEGARYRGLTFWTPNVNIFRDPRWGRGQETYGEDPFLTARLGVAFVRGLQGDDPRHLQAAACAKHFAVHSGPEALRHRFDVAPPAADLHETYLPAFEALVREGRVETVMTAYNALYGEPCAINARLYALLARWGFDGHIVSDCGAIEDLKVTYQRAPDDAGAEALALKAGLNLRCGEDAPALADAVRRGLITEAEVDYRLGRLLRTLFRLGLFDPRDAVAFNRIAPAENNTPAHAALALQAARESLVLLKNDGVLPLARERLRRVAVIGPNADSTTVLLGNYNGTPTAPVTILAGLRAALGPAVAVDHACGSDYVRARPGPQLVSRSNLRAGEYSGMNGEYFDNAALAGEPVARRRDKKFDLDFTAEGKLPAGLTHGPGSVRWQGELLTIAGGDYALTVRGRGGFRLKIAGETVIEAWEPREQVCTVRRKLPAGAALPVTLEYRQGAGAGSLRFEWELPEASAGFAEALALARAADVIVFAGGISAQLEGEEMAVDFEGFQGGDRTRIELPEVQETLLRQLHALGKPIVYVQLSGSAVASPWAAEHVNAIVQAWYPGQAAGTAVADVLLGVYNPAGRLPLTFYRATADLPPFEDYAMAGRTYRYFPGRPLYAFGHGLSYTTFAYANLRMAPAVDGGVQASVDVKNTGSRDGDEVVQLYAVPPAARERQALCGFARVPLKAGESRTVTLTVPAGALRRWSEAAQQAVVPAGEWRFLVGAASDDIRQTAVVKR